MNKELFEQKYSYFKKNSTNIFIYLFLITNIVKFLPLVLLNLTNVFQPLENSHSSLIKFVNFNFSIFIFLTIIQSFSIFQKNIQDQEKEKSKLQHTANLIAKNYSFFNLKLTVIQKIMNLSFIYLMFTFDQWMYFAIFAFSYWLVTIPQFFTKLKENLNYEKKAFALYLILHEKKSSQ